MSAVKKRARYLLFIAIGIAVALCLWYPAQEGINHLRFLWQKKKIEQEVASGIRTPDEATREMALLKFMNKDYDGAIDLFKGLVARHPENVDFLADLATFEADKILSLRARGLEPSPTLLKDAEEHAMRAKTLLDSEFPDLPFRAALFYCKVGGVFVSIGPMTVAKECFEKALELYNRPEVPERYAEQKAWIVDEIDTIDKIQGLQSEFDQED